MKTTHADSELLPLDLAFIIYSDGVTSVEYYVESNPIKLSVYTELFGSMIEDLLVFDQNGFPLEYMIIGSGITVDSLGATNLYISYLTPSMTSKEGAIWSFNVSLPITSKITLPLSSTIIFLDPIPLEITLENEKSVLTMPPEHTAISYLVGVINTETQAIQAINETETIINEAKAREIILSESENLLQQARDALDERDYIKVKLLAEEAKNNALEVIQEADKAETKIEVAQLAIDTAKDSDKTIGLEKAEELLNQALKAYSKGEYSNAINFADQAFQVAIAADIDNTANPYLFPIGVIVVVILIAAIYSQTRKPPKRSVIEIQPVDLEYLFDIHDNLREDDREVIQYIAEKGGEAFAMEIRNRFEIPRTSAWRLIRRLQRFEIVDERKIGGQTLVRIKNKFRKEVR